MEGPQSFGQWLRRRRRELDLTQDALARQVGCARVTIRKLEADDIRPSRQLAELLAGQLGIPTAERDQFVQFARAQSRAGSAHQPSQPAEMTPWREAPAAAPKLPGATVTLLLSDTAGLSSDFPPLKSAQASRHNLPVPLTTLIGRERELAAIQQALQRARLVTLTGPGGTGKTRLALQTAGALLEMFADGVWWVELAALQSPGLVAQAAAKAAGVREIPNQPLVDTLADALKAQRVLLVLDNCEHLIAASAQLAERLLSAGPHVSILATSREALNISGETTWPVPALALPDPHATPAIQALSQVESIRLFIDRALAVHPGFEWVEQNAPAVVNICQRLGGMPLAIELAAARARMLSVDEIARRLDDRFDLLTAGSRTALPRQQTLRATIDWSYDLLSEPERTLFRRLSVFAGGFRLAAAEAVAAGGSLSPAQVVHLLGQLINKSLVTVGERSPGSAPDTRYGMLETIHEYARQKCEAAGEADDLRERHLEYFTALAQQAENGITSSEQAAWYRRLDQELDNLRAAMSWRISAAGEAGPRQRSIQKRQLLIVGSLPTFWERGYRREMSEAVESMLARDDPSQPSLERAKALSAGGFVLLSSNRLSEARAYLEETVALSEQLGDPITLALSLGFLGWTLDFLGEYDSAKIALERSVAIGKALGDNSKHAVEISLSLLGDIPYQQGNLPAARKLYEDAIAFIRELHNKHTLTYPLRRLAFIMLREGDAERAAELLGESLELNREVSHLQGLTACLAGFSAIHLARGRLKTAAVLCGCVETQLKRIGMPLYLIDTVEYERCLAQVQARLDQDDLAAALAAGRGMTLEQSIEFALQG